MPVLCRPAVAVPEHVITQEETLDPARTLHAGHPSLPLVLRLIRSTGVARRHLLRPLGETLAHPGFEARNARYEAEAKARVRAVVAEALGHAGLGPRGMPSDDPARPTAGAHRAPATGPTGPEAGPDSGTGPDPGTGPDSGTGRGPEARPVAPVSPVPPVPPASHRPPASSSSASPLLPAPSFPPDHDIPVPTTAAVAR